MIRSWPRTSTLLIFLIITWYVGGWIASILIDGHDFLGLRTKYETPDGPRGIWSAYFGTWGPTELFQWFSLFGFAFFAMKISGKQKRDKRSVRSSVESTFWLLLAIVGTWALIEDGLDMRDQIAKLDFISTIVVTALSFGSLILLTSYALLFKGIELIPFTSRRVLYLFLIGFFFYGLAVISDVGHVNSLLGKLVDDLIMGGHLANHPAYSSTNVVYSAIGDSIIEEGLEFLGASLLFTAAVTRWEEIK